MAYRPLTSSSEDRCSVLGGPSNAFSYRHGTRLRDLLGTSATRHIFIKPDCPWQNGKVERLNRTLQTEWAYRQVFLAPLLS